MNNPKVAAILCARMSSERLLGKVMRSYHPNGKNNLECIADRIFTSRHNVHLVIATSVDKSDDAIEYWADDYGRSRGDNFGFYRGDLRNVVRRFDESLKKFVSDASYVWRVMGDCPLLDVGLNDWRTDVLIRTGADSILVNAPEPTYAAMGSVWSREAWDYCAKMSSGSLLGHPGELIWENQSQFRILGDVGPESVYYQPVRTELDTEEDLEFFRQVWQGWQEECMDDIAPTDILYAPDTKSVLTWLSSQPHIVAINSHITEKTHSTYLHGHNRARRFICQKCESVIAYRFNDKLSLRCANCGETRDYY